MVEDGLVNKEKRKKPCSLSFGPIIVTGIAMCYAGGGSGGSTYVVKSVNKS